MLFLFLSDGRLENMIFFQNSLLFNFDLIWMDLILMEEIPHLGGFSIGYGLSRKYWPIRVSLVVLVVQ